MTFNESNQIKYQIKILMVCPHSKVNLIHFLFKSAQVFSKAARLLAVMFVLFSFHFSAANQVLDLPQYESIVEIGHFRSASHVVLEQKQISQTLARTQA